jgi:hypothetical protein
MYLNYVSGIDIEHDVSVDVKTRMSLKMLVTCTGINIVGLC